MTLSTSKQERLLRHNTINKIKCCILYCKDSVSGSRKELWIELCSKVFCAIKLKSQTAGSENMIRWKLELLQTVFAGAMFLMAVFTAKPVFLTSIQRQQEKPLTFADLMMTLAKDTQLGYAPATEPYNSIMLRVGLKLNKTVMSGMTEADLNDMLYQKSRGTPLKYHVIWVIWKPKEGNVWKFSIRCTELAESTRTDSALAHNMHLRVGFLAVQMAVSEALVEDAIIVPPRHRITLVAMPMSPLMREEKVRNAMTWILLCFTLAFIPPVMEISALVVTETTNRYKRALRIRDVGYSCMYIGWLSYAYLTVLPICMLAGVALILIFRWIFLFFTLLFVLAYISVMIMMSLIVGMFQNNAHTASIWTGLFSLLQLFLAELLVHHGLDDRFDSVSFLLHIILPPLGLVHGFHSFALLQTGRGSKKAFKHNANYTVVMWLCLTLFYFGVLMLLQRTIGHERAIGGQVSWKSIIFKKAVDVHKLRVMENPTGKERDKLQEVDELLAKAISFRDVSKSIMGAPVLKNITLDIYRGEYTMLFAERIQERILVAMEDLITGLAYPDKGTINVLGYNMEDSPVTKNIITQPGMVGFCHRSQVLVEEFTVLEELQFFTELCLWDEPTPFIAEFFLIQTNKLLRDCDLEDVRHVRVRDLDIYYKAQLCWAIAMMLEPRIVYVPYFLDEQRYMSVINDKIVRSRSHLTIVKLCFSTHALEQGDRVFFFDHKVLVFGGSPAYMFFKFGREYRVRMTFRIDGSLDNEHIEALLLRAAEVGARVRAHLGSLLILRLPTRPTDKAAAFIRDLTENSAMYEITSLHVSLPDSDEICRRAVNESRKDIHGDFREHEMCKDALRKLSRPKVWKRQKSWFINSSCFRESWWKYLSFYVYYRFYLIVTIIAAIVTGIIIGVSLSVQLISLAESFTLKKMLHGEKMTVESLEQETTLAIKADNSTEALNLATAYVLSHTHATPAQVADMYYTALPGNERIIEYLMLRAVDAPQQYVYMFAYGLVVTSVNGFINLDALYSPIHHDSAAAARSIARLYMALLRHYTGAMDADIEVTDDPLVIDSSPMLKHSSVSPLIIQFMLILTISHITLLPSKEHGLIRHAQAHAMNFSPAQYWFVLFCCDLILYWMLVGVMSAVLFCVMYLVAPVHFMDRDLIVIPFMLLIYGLSCVPQAYLFSLGESAPLNTMTFVIINIVFGEATVISQIFYGNVYNYAERLLSLSPQYNVAHAFIRMTQIFVYNSECVLFNNRNLCSSNMMHRCCQKCGIMEPCFERISYLSRMGILDELIATLISGVLFICLLAAWEYKIVQRYSKRFLARWVYRAQSVPVTSEGVTRDMRDVNAKILQMKLKRTIGIKKDTYGEHLLVHNLTRRDSGRYILRNVSFGIGKGQALAVVGLKRHGRLRLCEILAGYRLPSDGDAYTMSKWSLFTNPVNYARNVSLCCFENAPLPPWMTVFDALVLIAVLRGVPRKHVKEEVQELIDALELHERADMDVCRLHLNERTRLNFAAAVVGAPPVLVLDECTAYQKYSVDRAMYYILYHLRKRGHAIFVSSASVESHMPVTNHLAILLDGRIYDIDSVDRFVERYGQRGYTVVVHLKDELDVRPMFSKYFKTFIVNDTADVLANVQVLDPLNYAQIFSTMEQLLKDHSQVYSYIISAIPMDYIYNKILTQSSGCAPTSHTVFPWWTYCCMRKSRKKKRPSYITLGRLEKFEKKYDLTTLKELPWSVIFQR